MFPNTLLCGGGVLFISSICCTGKLGPPQLDKVLVGLVTLFAAASVGGVDRDYVMYQLRQRYYRYHLLRTIQMKEVKGIG